jgi:hypothetical protein
MVGGLRGSTRAGLVAPWLLGAVAVLARASAFAPPASAPWLRPPAALPPAPPGGRGMLLLRVGRAIARTGGAAGARGLVALAAGPNRKRTPKPAPSQVPALLRQCRSGLG